MITQSFVAFYHFKHLVGFSLEVVVTWSKPDSLKFLRGEPMGPLLGWRAHSTASEESQQSDHLLRVDACWTLPQESGSNLKWRLDTIFGSDIHWIAETPSSPIPAQYYNIIIYSHWPTLHSTPHNGWIEVIKVQYHSLLSQCSLQVGRLLRWLRLLFCWFYYAAWCPGWYVATPNRWMSANNKSGSDQNFVVFQSCLLLDYMCFFVP